MTDHADLVTLLPTNRHANNHSQDQEHQMDTQINPSVDATAADEARRAKVEELQRRRSARSGSAAGSGAGADATAAAEPVRSAPRLRGGAAQGSKIAVAGFGLATMLGLVAAMGFAGKSSASAPAEPVATIAPAQVVVMVHPADGSAATAAVPGAPVVSGAGVVVVTPSQPIVLSAQPAVRQAPASQAPAGQTNGSR